MFKIKYIYKATRLDDTLINHTTIHPSIRPSVQHRYKSDGGKKHQALIIASTQYLFAYVVQLSRVTYPLEVSSRKLPRELQKKKKNQNKSLK